MINIQPYFINPTNDNKIHILLDASHMVKLVRNTLGGWGSIYDHENQLIKWTFLKELVRLEDESGLHCATRLRSRHLTH